MNLALQTKEYQFRGKSFKIAFTEDYQTHPSWWTYEDEASVRERFWNINPGDCILDVGAAHGSYTITALANGAAKSFAWSPQDQSGLSTSAHPSNGIVDQEYFLESLKLNGWEDKCEIYTNGIYDHSGWLDTTTQVFSTTPSDHPDIIQVDTLDNWYNNIFLKKFNPTTFSRYWLKIDVEGAEVHVLNGASQVIKELRPNIMVENHQFKDDQLEQKVRDFILKNAYKEIGTAPYGVISHSLYEPK